MDETSHEIISLKVTASLALILSAAVAIPIVAYGSLMGAFGPDSYKKSDTTVALILTTAVFLGPVICLWIPSKWSLVIGAVILAPVFFVGCLFLAAPLFGVPVLIPVVIWYSCAYSLWKKYAESGRRH